MRIVLFTFLVAINAFGIKPGTLIPLRTLPGTQVVGTSLTITAPVERQIVQRNGSNQATVTIAGSSSAAFDTIEAKVLPRTGFTGTGTAWASIFTHASGTGSYTGTLTVTGGWYNVLVRSKNSGTVIAQNVVQRFGVGEIFIGAGQSMLTDSTVSYAYAANDNVSKLSLAGAWTHGDDPYPNVDGTGGSVWPALGDALSTHSGLPIGFVAVATGGSFLVSWLSGASNWNTKLAPAMALFAANGYRAIMWEQGQADGSTGVSQATYTANLKSVIDSSRSTDGWTIPWIIAKSTWLSGGVFPNIQAAQVDVGSTYATCFLGPDDDSLGNTFRQPDQTHFTNSGAVSQAALWATALETAFGL